MSIAKSNDVQINAPTDYYDSDNLPNCPSQFMLLTVPVDSILLRFLK